ncbi:MAG: transglycosylase SLT domain-containing protein [Colwellia sp.]|nr:transglycosylase SLT domain-containing protein [Colwellia sp.]MCW9081472.1 transglycosylase SLT domain-containing protein [Colwellia sp.]
MKISSTTSAVLLALTTIVSSQVIAKQPPPEDDPFAELDQAMEAFEYEGSKAEMQEFEQWKAEYLAEYQKFRQEHFQKLDDIRDNLISLWGDAEVSTQEEFVDYSQDKTVKTVLDFEKNEIRVSVLHDNNEAVSQEAVVKALTVQAQKDDTLSQLVGENVDQVLAEKLITSADKAETKAAIAVDKKNVIAKEIKIIEQQSSAQEQQIEKVYDLLNTQEETKPENASTAQSEEASTEKSIAQQKAQIEKEKLARIAKLQAQTAKLEKNNKQKEALKNKKITTFTMPLAHKNDLAKAEPFISQVKNESERWQLSPSLMLAIMHTESYFNPKAQSHVPAFGLMQIVPRTAGVDVNRFLYKKDQPMAQSYLFLPNQNIETGGAYLHILNSRYLRKIKNPQSRLYCIVAAYNTGSGNVAKTFNKDKSRNINRAAKIINTMTPDEVFQRLVEHLPYDETKHYIQRVIKRQNIYLPLDRA